MKAAASTEHSTHQAWTRSLKVSRMAVLMPLSLRLPQHLDHRRGGAQQDQHAADQVPSVW